MPLHYRIDQKREIVFITADGIITDADLLTHLDDIENDSDFHPSFNRLNDYRAVESLDVTGAGVRALASRVDASEASCRRAIVVSTELAYGMARMFQILTDDKPATIEVFKDMAEARKWLGLDSAHPS